MMTLRPESGTYALHLDVDAPHTRVVGRLGTMDVTPGTYVYVGSAFGPGGVRARVRRHQRGTDAPHWHIDYLRPLGTLRAVWHTYDTARRECLWAATLRALPGAAGPLAGFGASDCTCPSHLIRFPARPDRAAFWARLQAAASDHAAVHTMQPGAPPG